MKIYVACLASYNNGVLHGQWIDADSRVDVMQEQVIAMLRASKFPNVMVTCPDCTDGDTESSCQTCKGTGRVYSAEEYAIHDYDDMPESFGEYCGLQAIADYVEFIETIESDTCLADDEAQALAKAMIENWHSVDLAESALENFVGVYDTFREYADESADEMLSCHENLPDIVSRYFDYEAWARDLAIEMTALDLPDGVAVFHP